IGFQVIAYNTSGTDVSSFMFHMSSMTCDSGDGIVSVAVSSTNVWDTTTRPIQDFSAWYVKNAGLSNFPWGHSEYNEKMYPLDMRAASQLWADRPFHDLY